MATYSSTTFGGISGRHGTAVASVGKTGYVLKVFKAPSNPNSDKQIEQRTRFGFVNSTMVCMRELFKYTFRHKGGYNYGISLAMRYAISGTAPDLTIDYSKLIVCEGSLYRAAVSMTKLENRKLKLSWSTVMVSEKASQAKNSDLVYVVCFNEELREACLFDAVAKREDETAEVTVPESWAGKTHVWLYFGRADESLESTSTYLAEVQY